MAVQKSDRDSCIGNIKPKTNAMPLGILKKAKTPREMALGPGQSPGHRPGQTKKAVTILLPGEMGQSPAKLKPGQPTVPKIDVEAMLRENKTSQINATTLLLWLREKGICCTCKEKKAELVAKAVQLLQPD